MISKYGLTLGDFEGRLDPEDLASLTNAEGTGQADEEVLESKVRLAEDEFEGYAGVYYATPVRLSDGTTVPPIVRTKLIEAVVWYLVSSKQQWLSDEKNAAGFFLIRKELVKWYERLVDRELGPRLIPGAKAVATASPALATSSAEIESTERRFTKTSMAGF